MKSPPYPAGSGSYPERSRAALVAIMNVLGLVVVGLPAPLAWVVGHRELAAIDAGRRSPANRGIAQAGRALGIAGTALGVLLATVFTLAIVGIIRVD
jgi:hypothetical protein